MSRLVSFEKSGKIPVEALLELAEDQNASMSMYGIMALGRNKSVAAATKLAEMAKKHRKGNRILLETIIDALGETGQRAAAGTLFDLIGIRFGWWDRFTARLKGKGLSNEKEENKRRDNLILPVARAMEKLEDPRAAEAMAPFLDHQDPLVRWHVIQTLQRSRVSDFNDQLRAVASSDESDMVREAAGIADQVV